MAPSTPDPKPINILILNPNSSTTMTSSLSTLLSKQSYPPHITLHPLTTPSAPLSINNEHPDGSLSTAACIDLFTSSPALLTAYDGFVIACYSTQSFVPWLRAHVDKSKPVIGIFEASVRESLRVISSSSFPSLSPLSSPAPTTAFSQSSSDPTQRPPPEPNLKYKFGIVSTASYWSAALTHGISLLSSEFPDLREGILQHFGGVETTGLNASELHELERGEVDGRMAGAVRRLVRRGGRRRGRCGDGGEGAEEGEGGAHDGKGDGNGKGEGLGEEDEGEVRVICLGCAGMAGMDEVVRAACVEEMGEERGREVVVIDGVLAGVRWVIEEIEWGGGAGGRPLVAVDG